ncbi:hypothetical protein LguiA_002471 [Lonicera macranthoides]
MNSIQVTACQPAFNVLHSSPSMQCVAPPLVFQRHKNSSKSLYGSLNCQCMRLPRPSLKLTARVSRYRQCTPVCVFGDKGKSGGGNEVNPLASLENALGSFSKKEVSLEDALRERIEKGGDFDDGGSDGNRPGRGEGGGGGNFGRPEDDDFSEDPEDDEPWQIFGATVGIIVLYLCILDYESVKTLTIDVIKLMLGRGPSSRLKEISAKIGNIIEMAKPEVEEDPYWLEREILSTPTLYDIPKKDEEMSYKSERDKETYSESETTLTSSKYYENDENDDNDF